MSGPTAARRSPPRTSSGGRRHPEPCADLGERLVLAQVGQDEKRLLAGVEQPPGRPDRLASPADQPGTVEQHVETSGSGDVIVVINPSTRGLSASGHQPTHRDHAVTSGLLPKG